MIVIGAIAVAAFLTKNNTKTSANTKKDIPLLTVGFLEGGGVPKYPINYSFSNDTVFIALQLFEGLVGYQNQTKIVPLLATSWYNTNSDTWVFNLRHGVKFHDGNTMTAQDVKYTLDYAVANQNQDGGDSTYFEVSDIKQVKVTGPYQVTITTNTPDAVLLNQLSLIGIVDSKAKLGSYDAGTGPYMVKPGTTPSVSSIDLVAYNNYWGGHVYTREVDITLEDNPNQLAKQVAEGKFDVAGEFDNAQLSMVKHYTPIDIADQGLNYIGVNTERSGSPLQSLAARQAIAYALNIPAILKAGGLQGQQASQLVPLILPGHNPAIHNTPYDPAKAKQLLSTVSDANSPITFAYPNGDGPQTEEMAKELDAVGFNIKLEDVNNFNDFINDSAAGQYDLFTLSDTSATVDGLDLLTDILEDNSDYNNSQINNLLSATGSTLNSATRISDMQQVATIVYDQKPIIPLYTETRVYTLTKPYIMKADLPSLYTSTYFWKVYQK